MIMRAANRMALLFLLPFLAACSMRVDISQLENDVRETERAFANMAASEGLAVAFHHFAAEEAVIKRGGKLIEGRTAIRNFYKDQAGAFREMNLDWEPQFIKISESGDLAYTYGPFESSSTDTLGQEKQGSGFFHTVWERQPDGSWRYVWD